MDNKNINSENAKSSRLKAISKLVCPRCNKGDLFVTPTFSFKKPFEMNAKCKECGYDFEPEPGYYYGAMFISYIWTGWFCLIFLFLGIYVLGFSLDASFLALIIFMSVMFVWIFRVSRAMWLSLNYKKK